MKGAVEEALLNGAIIVLDTNIYDRSPEFSRFSIEVLDKVKEKIYLPEIVKNEFLKNHKSCFKPVL